MSALLTGRPKLKGVLFGVFAVTALPSLFPAESLYTNPVFNAEFTFAAGGSVTYIPNCTGSHALISIDILAFWQAAGIPKVVSCQAGVPQEPYGDFFVLDTLKQAQFQAAIAGYDAYISAKADSLGWVYFDPNPLLGQLKAAGAVPTLPNLASRTQTFGPFITLDGFTHRRWRTSTSPTSSFRASTPNTPCRSTRSRILNGGGARSSGT